MVRFRIDIFINPRPAVKANEKVQDSLDRTGKKGKTLQQILRRTFLGIGAGFLIRQVVKLSDTFTELQNRLRLVTDGQRQLSDVTDRLFESSNATRSSFRDTATLYARVALSAKQLGRSQSELVNFTKSVNQAIKLSGASAQEANAGLIQLSQGLASNTLRGDELRSVLEQIPFVADVIAKQMGVTRGELRKMGEQGKISAEIVLDAFKNARQEIADKFANTIPTISEGFTVLGNRILITTGRLNELTGFFSGIAKLAIVVAENLDGLIIAALSLSTVLVARLAFSAIPKAIASMNGLTAATLSTRAAFVAAALAVGLLINRLDEYNKNLAAIRETNEQLLKDDTFAVLGQSIQRNTQEINSLNRAIAEQQKRGFGPSPEQIARLAELGVRTGIVKDELKKEGDERKANIAILRASDAAAKAAIITRERQKKLLESILKPQRDFLVLQKDLNKFVKQGAIDQATANKVLERARPKVQAPDQRDDPFKKQLDSLKELNEELVIKDANEGFRQKAKLIELKLSREGVKLERDEQDALAAVLLSNQDLTEGIKERTKAEKERLDLVEDREENKNSLIAELDLTKRIVDEAQLLREILKERPDLEEEIIEKLKELDEVGKKAAETVGEGFVEAFRKAKEEAKDFAAIGEGLFNAIADNLTDVFVRAATEGRASIKDFTRAILADLAKIFARLLTIKLLEAVTGGFGGLFGGGLGGGGGAPNLGRQTGGQVQPGQRVTVGENGPETVEFGRTGVVIPNQAQAAAPVVNVNNTIVNQSDPKEFGNFIEDEGSDNVFLNKMQRLESKLAKIRGS